MPFDPVSCPYCNAIVSAAGVTPTCPRCGEVLPGHLAEAIQSQPASLAAPLPGPAVPSLHATPSRSSIRRVAGMVIGIMGVMAIISFTYAWHTVAWRRARDPRPPRPVVTGPERAAVPIELSALRYLPADTVMVAGLHVAEAEKTPRGKDFLQSGSIGAVPITPADLEGWTGLKLGEIDHAVLGLKMEARIIPPFVLVVQTRQPLDQARVRATLKAEQPGDVGKKKVWHFPAQIGKLSLKPLVWFAAPQTLVIALSRVDMEKVPDQPATEASHLPEPLRDAIKGRVNPAAHAWLAGDVASWEAITPLLMLVLDKENVQMLASLRTFGFGVHLSSGIRLEGMIRGVDDAATARLEQRWGEMPVPAVAKELEPLFREMSKSYRREIKDGWLMLSAEADGKAAAPATPP